MVRHRFGNHRRFLHVMRLLSFYSRPSQSLSSSRYGADCAASDQAFRIKVNYVHKKDIPQYKAMMSYVHNSTEHSYVRSRWW